jgi:hypothetical protein
MDTKANLPTSLAGFQLVCTGKVEKGDLLVPRNSLSSLEWELALEEWAGADIDGEGYAWHNWRVYRRSSPPKHLDRSTETVSTVEPILAQSSIPDTGERRSFSTGAVRDASLGKGHFHSIPPIALRKLAKRFEDGAKKYAKNNWMKGIPLSAYVDSINRHLLAIAEGDTTEDHHGALIWNSCAMTWTDEEIQAGRLPKELDDLPYRQRRV